jgi:hypothetical protein
MTMQEHIERDVRLLIGDLQFQVVVLNARVQELQQELANRDAMEKAPGPELPPKHNGKVKEASLNG